MKNTELGTSLSVIAFTHWPVLAVSRAFAFATTARPPWLDRAGMLAVVEDLRGVLALPSSTAPAADGDGGGGGLAGLLTAPTLRTSLRVLSDKYDR